MKTSTDVVLDNKTETFIDSLNDQKGPPIYKLSPKEARQVLENLQAKPVETPAVQIENKTIPGPKGDLTIQITRPKQSTGKLPALMFFHGAGWVLGSADTHHRLVCDLCVGANVAVIFVNYSRSPEVRFPTAIEEAYAATKYIADHAKELNLDTSHFAVFGDSVGGNMAIAVTMLAKERHGPKIDLQVLFYPVTSSDLNSESYHKFAEGPWLTKAAMEWFWDAYEPDTNNRKKALLSPLNATIDQLKGLPKALIITAENDVLRDEGEAYAHKLMQAGVEVTAFRNLGTIHDFALLNPLAKSAPTLGSITLATAFLRKVLHKS